MDTSVPLSGTTISLHALRGGKGSIRSTSQADRWSSRKKSCLTSTFWRKDTSFSVGGSACEFGARHLLMPSIRRPQNQHDLLQESQNRRNASRRPRSEKPDVGERQQDAFYARWMQPRYARTRSGVMSVDRSNSGSRFFKDDETFVTYALKNQTKKYLIIVPLRP
jgi:hypothetical protein